MKKISPIALKIKKQSLRSEVFSISQKTKLDELRFKVAGGHTMRVLAQL